MRANFATQLTAVLMMVATAACQDPTSPAMPDPDQDPSPEPQLLRVASVVLRRIDIEGACDGTDLFGDPRKGHFAYKITVRLNNITETGGTYTRQSTDYGKALGQTFLRGPGESIDLNDYTYGFYGLSSGESVTVTLAAIEWDLIVKDYRMDGAKWSQTKSYPGADGTQYYELNLGPSGCKVELEYSIAWSTP